MPPTDEPVVNDYTDLLTYNERVSHDHVDPYTSKKHGPDFKVKDPFHRLEDLKSEETKRWWKRQDGFTQQYLGKYAYWDEAYHEMERAIKTESVGVPPLSSSPSLMVDSS